MNAQTLETLRSIFPDLADSELASLERKQEAKQEAKKLASDVQNGISFHGVEVKVTVNPDGKSVVWNWKRGTETGYLNIGGTEPLVRACRKVISLREEFRVNSESLDRRDAALAEIERKRIDRERNHEKKLAALLKTETEMVEAGDEPR